MMNVYEGCVIYRTGSASYESRLLRGCIPKSYLSRQTLLSATKYVLLLPVATAR